jgi:peroxiredoxin Q/BCP
MGSRVKVGEKAPDFTLPKQDGTMVSLHDYEGKQNVVIYFYPKDFTMGCTTETISFSENYEGMRSLGAEVIGVSSDSVDSHRGFAEKCRVGFVMVSDAGGKVRESYGVPSSLGLVPGRVTYVIDKMGVVRHVFSSQLNPKRHVSEAMEALKALPG